MDFILNIGLALTYMMIAASLYHRLFVYNPIKSDNELMERFVYRRQAKYMHKYKHHI